MILSSWLIFSVAKHVWKCALDDSFSHDWLICVLCCHLPRSQGRVFFFFFYVQKHFKQQKYKVSRHYAQRLISCNTAFEPTFPLSVLSFSWSMMWTYRFLWSSGYGQGLPASSSSTALLIGRENLFLPLRTSDTCQYMSNTYTIWPKICPKMYYFNGLI